MKMVVVRRYMFILSFIFCSLEIFSQEIPDEGFTGVAISPSTMHLSIKPGETVTKQITITNNTKKKYTFQLGFQDFDMDVKGDPSLPPMEKYSLAKYISLSPNYVEIDPGEQKKVNVIISIPDEEEAYVAMWTMIVIDEIINRPPLDYGIGGPDKLVFGVNATIGFGVFVYQNPPNVKINKLNIENFQYIKDKRQIEMIVRNVGDGISYSVSYVEITNLNTGDQRRLQPKRFTILPQHLRNFLYQLPSDLEPGIYSAVGVVDYGHEEEIIAAELEFKIP